MPIDATVSDVRHRANVLPSFERVPIYFSWQRRLILRIGDHFMSRINDRTTALDAQMLA